METFRIYDDRAAALLSLNQDPPQGFRFKRSHQYKDRPTRMQHSDANLDTGVKLVNNNAWTSVYYCCQHLVRACNALASSWAA